MLQESLGSGVAPDQDPKPNNETPIPPAEPSKNGRVNGIGALLVAPAIPQELASIWKRMCTRRGVVRKFEGLKNELETLAGSKVLLSTIASCGNTVWIIPNASKLANRHAYAPRTVRAAGRTSSERPR